MCYHIRVESFFHCQYFLGSDVTTKSKMRAWSTENKIIQNSNSVYFFRSACHTKTVVARHTDHIAIFSMIEIEAQTPSFDNKLYGRRWKFVVLIRDEYTGIFVSGFDDSRWQIEVKTIAIEFKMAAIAPIRSCKQDDLRMRGSKIIESCQSKMKNYDQRPLMAHRIRFHRSSSWCTM